MTGDARRDHEATEHRFAAPDVPWTDDDYAAAQQAEPCRCWQQRPVPHDGHCCMRDVGDGGATACGHTDPKETGDA